jgi:hypothetical protein
MDDVKTSLATRMAQSIAAAEGAATPDTATPNGAVTTEPVEGEPVSTEAAEKDQGQPEKTPDPWDALKEHGSPEEVLEKIKEAENAKAMRREASYRNAETAKARGELEDLKRQVQSALGRNEQLVDAASLAFAEGNEELGAQYMRMVAAQRKRDGYANGTPAPAAHAQPQDIQAQIDARVQERFQQYAYGDGVSRVTSAAILAVERSDILNKPKLKELGVPEQVVEAVVRDVIEQGRADPDFNIFDPRAMQARVAALTKKHGAFWEKVRDANVNDYRAERKALNAKAPPSGKGPSASVRSGPEHGPSIAGKSHSDAVGTLRDRIIRRLAPPAGRATEV